MFCFPAGATTTPLYQSPLRNGQILRNFWPKCLLTNSPSRTQDEASGEALTLLQSDDYFAWQLKRSGVAVLAAERGVLPLGFFATNAFSLGDIAAEADSDGVLRRARAFHEYRHWHRAFLQVEADKRYGVDLNRVRLDRVPSCCNAPMASKTSKCP